MNFGSCGPGCVSFTYAYEKPITIQFRNLEPWQELSLITLAIALST